LSSTDRWARLTWESEETNFAEWYFSIALNSELDLAHNLSSKQTFVDPRTGEATTAAKEKKQRIFETARVKLPVYGFVTANCRARHDWYRKKAKSLTSYTVVDRSASHCPQPASVPHSHLDPLLAEDEGGHTNDFVVTLGRWLKRRI
jgi:hypothetical protein